jgi:F-type H+-transporting ATPase subunit epsilon
MILNVVTPEKRITAGLDVEAVVLPGALGQMTVLPGHIHLLSSLEAGTFAYKVKGEWTWAFLSAGFVQVADDKVNVLAETMEFAQEVDIAAAELSVNEVVNKLKALKLTDPTYSAVREQKEFAETRLRALKSKKH